MKYLFSFLFLIIATITLAQTNLEQELDTAEQELHELEQAKEQLLKDLVANGKIPKMEPQYIKADQAYKAQLAKTKTLRKHYKKVQREKKKNAAVQNSQPIDYGRGYPTMGTPKSAPTPNISRQQAEIIKQEKRKQKAEIKARKAELAELKRERTMIIKQAVQAGQQPMTLPRVQELDRLILAKENEINKIKGQPIQQPTIINTGIKNAQNVPVMRPEQATKPVQVALPTEPIKVTPVETPATPQIELPPIGLTTILFEKFSAEIPEKYDLYLNYIAKQMQENPAMLLNIEAFTDNSEKNRISLQLTASMANSVAQQMVNRGISPNRLVIKANGSKKAVGDNNTFFGQARNRRVELSFRQ